MTSLVPSLHAKQFQDCNDEDDAIPVEHCLLLVTVESNVAFTITATAD